GLWDLLGGFADEGEGPLETLCRELQEATGVEIEPLEFFRVSPDRYWECGVWTLNLYWTARIASGEPVPADDVAEVEWFAPGEIPPLGEVAFEDTVGDVQAW